MASLSQNQQNLNNIPTTQLMTVALELHHIAQGFLSAGLTGDFQQYFLESIAPASGSCLASVAKRRSALFHSLVNRELFQGQLSEETLIALLGDWAIGLSGK